LRALESGQTTEDTTVQGGREPASDDFFREVNERIAELGERFGIQEETLALVCECDDTGCTLHLSVPASEYRNVRGSRGWHVVSSGHEPSGRIVARGEGYVVVED
jgi:hypothetical protein